MSRIGMIVLLAAAVLAPGAMAGSHPRYLHARSDLRTAREFLRVREEPNVTRNLRDAEREVNEAIGEVTRAAAMDGKNLDAEPSIDTSLDRRGRFSRILALLRSARADIEQEEDNPAARGWRNAAIRHIDLAIDFVKQAARDAHIDRELGY
jgi:hypothetical protein